MHTIRSATALAAALAVGLVACVALGGCSSSDNNNPPVISGGTITGQTIAATENVGLGGVQVAIGTSVLVGGVSQFQAVTTTLSTTPNGDFALTGVPAGTYTRLHITPLADIGPEQDVVVRITVAEGQSIALGPVLVFDDLPPSPA